MRPDQVLRKIAALVESANIPEDPPELLAQPLLPLTVSSLEDVLRNMPDVRPVAALIRSLYPDRKVRCDLVLALYGMGRPQEDRLRMIVAAMDLLGELLASTRDDATESEAPLMDDVSTSALGDLAADPVATEPPVTTQGTGVAPPPAKDEVQKLLRRVVASTRLDSQIIRIFPHERERQRICMRLKRFARCSLERWTLIAGIMWCLDDTGTFAPLDDIDV